MSINFPTDRERSAAAVLSLQCAAALMEECPSREVAIVVIAKMAAAFVTAHENRAALRTFFDAELHLAFQRFEHVRKDYEENNR